MATKETRRRRGTRRGLEVAGRVLADLRASRVNANVSLESRVRDIQHLVRRTRLRERDGGVDAILILLADTAHNRRVIDELRVALGPAYATSPRTILCSLRDGRPLSGSGVVLV